MAFTELPEQVNLPGGVVVRIFIDPMPERNAKGGYNLAGFDGTSQRPSIRVSFSRDERVFHDGPWTSVVSGALSVVLDDGSVLAGESLEQLDSEGWEVLWKYGIIPTGLV